MGGRKVVEKWPGGPTVDVPVSAPGETEACCLCGNPADAALTIGGRPACRTCHWRYPFNVDPDATPIGWEMGGSGI
jgi:hypothetical protein